MKEEIQGLNVPALFGGTAWLGEVMTVVFAICGLPVTNKQRLVCLMLLAKSTSGEEIVSKLVVVLSTGLGIGPDKPLAAR